MNALEDNDDVGGLRWTWNRFRSMPAAEWPHRLRERSRRWRDHVRDPRRTDVDQPLPTWPTLPTPSTMPAAHIDALTAEADRLMRGDLRRLGVRYRALDAWNEDPLTGERWPVDRPAHSAHSGEGDPKLVWELHRLQHLVVLAQAHHVARVPGAHDRAVALLESWLTQHTAFRGVEYSGGVECACRVISLLSLTALLRIPTRLHRPLNEALAAHDQWIRRYPSLHSSANNHRVAELAGLICAGALRSNNVDDSVAELQDLALSLIAPDGVGTEQSPSYLACTLEWLLCVRVARRAPFSSPVEARLIAGAGFLCQITDRGGGVPNIGDRDDSSVIATPWGAKGLEASVAASVGAMLDAPHVVPAGHPSDLRAFMLGVTVPESCFVVKDRPFVQGGYTTWRRADGERELLVVLDHGPLGHGHTAGHGHADALAVWMHLDGRALLIDAGTLRYGGDSATRDFVRSARAHNTVEVVGLRQSEPSGPFNWARRAQAWRLPSQAGTRATHDGYKRAGYHHERELHVTGDRVVHVIDEVFGAGARQAVGRWLFAPDVVVELLDDHNALVLRDGARLMSVRARGPVTMRLGDGRGASPGLCSAGYNRSERGPVLELRAAPSATCRWTTTFARLP